MAKKGIEYCVFGKLQGDGTYADGKYLSPAAKFDGNPTKSSAKDYGDNRTVEADNSVTGGTLTVEFNNDEDELYTYLLGHQERVDGEEIVYNTEDEAPYVGVGAVGKSGSNYIVKFYTMVKFSEPNDENSTRQENTTFGHVTLEGEIFIPEDGEWKKRRKFKTLQAAKEYLNDLVGLIDTGKAPTLMTAKDKQALFLLNLKKNGKKYGVRFNDYSVTPDPTGERLYDAADMQAEPSTNTTRGRNDFEGKGPFAYLEVNGYVDKGGDFHVNYIKDYDPEFSRTRSDVWILFLTHYVYFEIRNNGEDTIISDTRHTDDWIPEGGAIRINGTIRPYVAIAKYNETLKNGVPSSVSGLLAENHSFQSGLTEARKKGMQYCMETSQDSERMTRLMEIAFATKHSQSVMAGCTQYYYQYAATVTETNAERIIIKKDQAKNLVIGSAVSIGNATALNAKNEPNIDRGQTGMHAKANRVKIIRIEDYDANNSAVYVDNSGKKFSTAATTVSDVSCPTYLSTMPWNTGGCDNVLGVCGSPTNNRSGKEPYILFGVEMSIGCWEAKGNTVMKIENHVMTPYICYDCGKMTTNGAATSDWIKVGYQIKNTRGQWKYISKLGRDKNNPEVCYPIEADATSTTGYADALYTENLDNVADAQREVLGVGSLINGAPDGRRVAYLNYSLGNRSWNYAARLSASGRCGRMAARG